MLRYMCYAMKKMPWNIVRHLFYFFFSPPGYHVTILPSSSDSIDLDMRPWITMQPNLPLTNICGLDLDMVMLDFKPSIVPVLHVYSTSVALYEDTCSILWVSDYVMLWWWDLHNQSCQFHEVQDRWGEKMVVFCSFSFGMHRYYGLSHTT